MERFREFLYKNINVLIYAFMIWLLSMLCITKAIGQTKQEVRDYIDSSSIEHKDIVFRQVLKETGHLKCKKCCLDHNNLLGFRYKHRHMEFNHWHDSIDYYIHWQKYKGYDGGDYYEFLKREWKAPDMDGYCETLKRIRI